MSTASHSPIFELRVASEEELPLLVEIDDDACQLYEAFGVGLGHLANGSFAVAERARWRDSLSRGRVFVATGSSGAALGFASCGFIDGQPYLDQLSVRLAAMGQGIGSALIEHSARWAREQSGRELWLTTYDHVPFNRPMYERRGFVVVPEGAWGIEVAEHVASQREHLPLPEERVAMRRYLVEPRCVPSR